MVKTTFTQKIGLLFFAVIITLLILEVGLCAGGWFFLFLQEKKNRQIVSGSEYCILCLGESTTALGGENAYPQQMERILNTRQKKLKFKVINKGVPAATTDHLLARVENYLDEYQPQMVVAMIGINDPQDLTKRTWRENAARFSKVFKLFDMIAAHWDAKKNETKSDFVDQQIAKLDSKVKSAPSLRQSVELLKANLYRGANRPEQEKRAILKVLALDAKDPQAWYLLGIYYQRHAEYQKALEALQQAYNFGSSLLKVSALERVAQCYNFLSEYAKEEKIYRDILKQWPQHPGANGALGSILLEQKNYSEAIKMYLRELAIEPRQADVYGKLAHCYRLIGQPQMVEQVFREGAKVITDDPEFYYEWGYSLLEDKQYAQAEHVFTQAVHFNGIDLHGVNERINERLVECYQAQGKTDKAAALKDLIRKQVGQYNPMTQKNYLTLANVLKGRHIILFAVQYPRRSIVPLAEMLSTVAGVVMVDNQKVFEDALREYQYDELFSDRFAGDFGHCTPKGNALLAGHVAEEILKVLQP